MKAPVTKLLKFNIVIYSQKHELQPECSTCQIRIDFCNVLWKNESWNNGRNCIVHEEFSVETKGVLLYDLCSKNFWDGGLKGVNWILSFNREWSDDIKGNMLRFFIEWKDCFIGNRLTSENVMFPSGFLSFVTIM